MTGRLRIIPKTELSHLFIGVVLLLAAILINPAFSYAAGESWQALGPGGALVNALTLSPEYTTDGTMLIATKGSGIYKSTDKGQTWAQVNSGLTGLNAYAIAFSPNYTTDKVILAAAWGANDGSIYKSTDQGESWTLLGGSPRLVKTIVVAPGFTNDNTTTVFAGTEGNGIYKSTDGGSSWAQINVGIRDRVWLEESQTWLNVGVIVRSLAISPNYTSDQTLFAAVGDNIGQGAIYKSTSGGQTWAQSGSTFIFVNEVALSPSFTSDNTILAAIGGTIYKTTDGGLNWLKSSTGLAAATYPTAIGFSPDFSSDRTVFAGTNRGVYKSTDGGTTWFQVNTGLTNKLVLALNASPNYKVDKSVFAGTYGDGVFSISGEPAPSNDDPPAPEDPPAGGGGTPGGSNPGGDTGSGGGSGGGAPKDLVPPAAPQGLKLVSNKEMIHIEWSLGQEEDLAGYNMYRRAKGEGAAVKLNAIPLIETQYRDDTAKQGVVYFYSVTALDAGNNEGLPSSELEASLAEVKAEIVFSDVVSGAWFREFVYSLASQQIIGGYDNGTFRPNALVTRAEFAKMICLAMGWDLIEPANPTFNDVPKTSWAYKYIETAKQRGVISGYSDGGFSPSKNITRAEIAKIIAATLNLSSGSSTFIDIGNHWAKTQINACVKAGIIGGYPNNTFAPNNTASRAEAAKMIYGMVNN